MKRFKSWRSYWDFERAVVRKQRYVWPREVEDFLNAVIATAQSRKVTLRKNSNFWRAQLGHDWREEKQDGETFETPCAHRPERMKPLRDRGHDGRANAKGIPCLYLSTRQETALSEVRPWIGSLVSVGQFKLLKDVEIIDCTRGHADFPIYFDEPSAEKIEEAVWFHIDRAFAEPMTRSDDAADYVPTQILAELFKGEGFGGVAYKSKFGENGYNIALFDIDAAELINCGLHRVDSIAMEFSEAENLYFISKHYDKKNKESD